LLANIYLNELDHLIGEKYRMVRYADDCVPRRRTGGRSPPCSYAA
jgi:retron-type reverse transcriptase